MATVSETGWPYVQHRGGPPGFLKVVDDKTLAFADYRGNRQYISTGNLAADDRACLFLMDYARPSARSRSMRTSRRWRLMPTQLSPSWSPCRHYRAKLERIFRLRLETFDWNCPQHITPRFTEQEIATAVHPLRDRLAQLEAENCRAARSARCTMENNDGAPNAPFAPVHGRDARPRKFASPRTAGTAATPEKVALAYTVDSQLAQSRRVREGREAIVGFLTPQVAARTGLSAHQGAVGLPRKPHRGALRLRVARRQRQLVPVLRKRELGIR